MLKMCIINILNSAIIIIGGVMRRRKIKVHYGNLFILIAFVGIVCFGGYFLMDHFVFNKDKISENKDDETIKHLVDLGYSKSDASKIQSNLSKDDVNKITQKYDNLVEFSQVKYFHIDNIDRYNALKTKNNSYSIEEIIMRVNTSVDKPYYTDIKTVTNPNELTALVNKYYAMPSDYEPDDLIKVGSQTMRKDAGEAMKKLLEDINDVDGLYLQAQSGYRSYNTQISIYNGWVNKDGQELADTYSARAGHSEHQTGLVMDVSKDGTLDKSFENTKEFKWLSENAYKYGFILRFPKDKIEITGYDYEPWHYRYVGVEIASLIHTEKITLEEYAVKYLGLY